jgi:hypothetical protein
MKKIIKACMILWCASFVFGCSDNVSIPEVREEEESRIALFIPGSSEVRVYSTATTAENYIEDCFVVVFKDGYKNSEKVDVSNIMANGDAMAMLPQLSFKIEAGDTVYVICNTGLTAVPANIESITANNINATFPPAKACYFSGEALPMSGSTVWSPTTSSTVTLTRAVAKVQVQLGESFSIGGHFDDPPPFSSTHFGILKWDPDLFRNNLNLCGFIVNNYAGKSDMMPPSSGLSHTRSDSTGVYGTYENVIRLMQYATADNMAVYVSEYPNSTTGCDGSSFADDVFKDKRQYLLMVDRIDNNNMPGTVAGSDIGFWRLDFYDAVNKKFLDIKRNHTYTFTINKIRSLPYIAGGWGGVMPLPEFVQFLNNNGLDTWNLPVSNIEYTIEVKEDWANAVYSNGQYALLLSADEINDGNVHLPFKIKVYVPAGVDPNQFWVDPNLYVVDRDGNNNSGSNALNTYNNGILIVQAPLPVDGTTTTLTFTWNPSHSTAPNFSDGSIYIVGLGNLQKRIPIKLTPLPP